MHNSLLTLIKKEDDVIRHIEVLEDIIDRTIKSRYEYLEKNPGASDCYAEYLIEEREKLKEVKHELATVRADIRRYLFNAGILPSVLN